MHDSLTHALLGTATPSRRPSGGLLAYTAIGDLVAHALAYLDDFFVCFIVHLYCCDSFFNITQDHVQMLIICLKHNSTGSVLLRNVLDHLHCCM